ncbi:Os06g0192950 [Oryza sativa Japonica Group]|uniref:Os06g0192950 protein n=1 Tax=Oryza sativa subsp. japonica TaxID=39947 RepID=A0A0P0WU50_ORYSJ|nr:hypothetical protein EE612_032427 [Oryza sativa]BAS96591.1 Os06g0192950 [Oryza sativa Japonica Group]
MEQLPLRRQNLRLDPHGLATIHPPLGSTPILPIQASLGSQCAARREPPTHPKIKKSLPLNHTALPAQIRVAEAAEAATVGGGGGRHNRGGATPPPPVMRRRPETIEQRPHGSAG